MSILNLNNVCNSTTKINARKGQPWNNKTKQVGKKLV